ncbi:MAG: hypothetical protein JXA09_13050 [Anaerolineae bacterium]|nr:hypothetical protein [Anaerolineae bacterium]
MTERDMQTDTYWREEFAVTDDDVGYIEELFLEQGKPLSLAELSRALITHYCHRQESAIRRQLARGALYRPDAAFTVGDQLVFPHLDFAVGTVVAQREGHNPEYEHFQVIAVEFEDDGGTREFAAQLAAPHKLSLVTEADWQRVFATSPDELVGKHGQVVGERLEERLRATGEFLEFRGEWFPKGVAADIHVGLLNIVEAMLVIAEKPLPPAQLLDELDLPAEIPEAVKVFSLNCRVSQDERFVDVGGRGKVVWGLRRWLPDYVVSQAPRLRHVARPYDRTVLDVAHLQMEREIDDPASALLAPPSAAMASEVTLILGYPHWRHGTLPLTARTRPFFPDGAMGQRTQFTFLDRVQNKEFTGWVAREYGYVYGLAKWYAENAIPAGAYIKLQRAPGPNTVAIDVLPRRMQREWTPMVTRTEEGELSFTMQKRPIACQYDELCLIDEPDRRVGDALWAAEQEQARPIDELVEAVFLELAKLTPSVTVHAKTVYTAVNVLRRSTPGEVFAALFQDPEFVTTGNGYWIRQARP